MKNMQNSRTKTVDLVIQAMLIALVFISTVFLNIKLPIASNGGLVHLGTAMLFIVNCRLLQMAGWFIWERRCYLLHPFYLAPKKERLQGRLEWGYLILLAAGLYGRQLRLYPEHYKDILSEKSLGQREAKGKAFRKTFLR